MIFFKEDDEADFGVDTQALTIEGAWGSVHLPSPKEVLGAIRRVTIEKDVKSNLAPISAAFFGLGKISILDSIKILQYF